MAVIRVINPKSRKLFLVKPYHLSGADYAGCIPAPWDCVCEGTCRCNERPTKPAPEQLEEARATLAKLQAGIAEVEIQLGIREPPRDEEQTPPPPPPPEPEPAAEPRLEAPPAPKAKPNPGKKGGH